ncbi:hypothetical protein [Neisseria yangbaofengii]|nr:hypothetical protein [Neisseria yangbaofengii]
MNMLMLGGGGGGSRFLTAWGICTLAATGVVDMPRIWSAAC